MCTINVNTYTGQVVRSMELFKDNLYMWVVVGGITTLSIGKICTLAMWKRKNCLDSK